MTRPYKLALLAAVILIVGIQVIQWPDSTPRTTVIAPPQALPPHTLEQPSEIAQLQQHIQQLETENLQLKQQVHKLLSMQATPDATTASNTTESAQLARLESLEMEKQQRKAKDIINWVVQSQEADSNFDLNNALLRRFEYENRDPVWAEQQEGYYRQLFSERTDLQGIALRDAQCRSTQCEITIGIANIEQSNQFFQTISSALATNGQPVTIMVAADARSGKSKLYISNNENSFDFN